MTRKGHKKTFKQHSFGREKRFALAALGKAEGIFHSLQKKSDNKQIFLKHFFKKSERTLMKLLIASDIHGDADCCQALITAANAENADKILLLGDILYHGPRNDLPLGYAPKKVIEMLNAISDKLICVRGNCEAEVDQMVLNFPCMSDTAVVHDSELGISLYMSHGHIYNPENLPPIPKGSAFLYGHTHLLSIEKRDEIICLNPGSVSLPKGGNPKTYATYNSGLFEIKTFDGMTLKSEKL